MRFSIIIPAYNEEECIVETLKKNLRVINRQNDEIVLVNDGSINRTEALAKRFARKNPAIKVLTIKHQGKYSALNKGIEEATGDFIVCTDADSFLAENSLQRIEEIFSENSDVSAIVGLVVPVKKGFLSEMQTVEYLFEQKILRTAQAKYKNVVGIPGPLFIFRRKDKDKLAGDEGVFNKSVVEDFELSIRMNERGLKILPVEEIFAYTMTPANCGDLRRQRLRWFGGTLYETLRFKAWKYNFFYGLNILCMSIGLPYFITCVILFAIGSFLMPLYYITVGGLFFAVTSLILSAIYMISTGTKNIVIWLMFPFYLFLISLFRLEALLRVVARRKIGWM